MGRTIRANSEEIGASRSYTPLGYRLFIVLLVATLIGVVIYQLIPALSGDAQPPQKLVIYGFSTQEEVFNQQIFPAFEAAWEEQSGRELTIEGVFGPSGTLANQIIMGAPADVAIFSNDQHVTWLRVSRLIDADARAAHIGVTPMVIVTRAGNPAGIEDFADLAQPGIHLLHAEPGQSGAGDWAVLAEYGSALLAGGDQESAMSQLKAIWNNVDVLSSSARATLTLFELGAGDALVTYEQDALLALDRGVPLQVVVPSRTIMAQHMAVIVDANVTRSERGAAEAFLHFLTSEEGQALLQQYHLRPAQIEVGTMGPVSQPFTVDDLGGWAQAYHELIEGVWEDEVAPQFEKKPLLKLTNDED